MFAGRYTVSSVLMMLRQRVETSAMSHTQLLFRGTRPFCTPTAVSRSSQHLLRLQHAVNGCHVRDWARTVRLSPALARGGVHSLHAQTPAAADSSTISVEVDVSVDGELEDLNR